jgi:hypothetical protein
MVAIAAFGRPAVSQVRLDTRDPRPCIALVQHGGNSPDAQSGLRLAAWPDGAVLMPRSDRGVGGHLLVGTLDPEEVVSVVETIGKAGFFAVERYGYAVPDGEYAVMLVRTGDVSAAHCWHECLSPNYGGNINTDLEYLSFVRMWRKAAGALYALTPSHVQRLAAYLAEAQANDFRGYDPTEPWQTPWMKTQGW